MKKLALFLALGVFIASQTNAETIICKKITLEKEGISLVSILKTMSTANNNIFCVLKGYPLGAATSEDIAKYEEEHRYSIDILSPSQNYSLDAWYKSNQDIDGQNQCFQDLTKSEKSLLASLQKITNTMNCTIMGLTPTSKKNTKQQSQNSHHKQSEVLASNKYDKIAACSCLSKVGPPSTKDAEVAALYNDAGPEFVKKKYLDSLLPIRIHEYALAKNILGEEGQKACQNFNNDEELQNLKDSWKLPAPIDSAFTTIKKQETADALFNISSTKQIQVPVITEKVFKNFAKHWACATHGLSKSQAGKKAERMINLQLQSTVVIKEVEIKDFKHDEATCSAPETENAEEVMQITYLEKMLATPLGNQKVPLLEQIVETLSNSEPSADNFENAFKSLVSSQMKEQCELSRIRLIQLSRNGPAAVLSDSELVEYLINKRKDKALEIQKLHCATMQRELQKNPEFFMKSFCDYNEGDTLPPKNCPAVGDFIRSKFFVSEKVNHEDITLDIARIDFLGHVRNSSASDYAIGASKVRFENVGSYSTFMKTASDNFSKSNNGIFNMDMSNFNAEKYTPASSSDRTTNIFSTPENNGTKQNNLEVTPSQISSDVKPYNGFNQEVKPIIPANTQLSPNVTFNNKTVVPQIVVTPQPTAAPAVSTTVIEKIVTPIATEVASKENEEEVKQENKKTTATTIPKDDVDNFTTGNSSGLVGNSGKPQSSVSNVTTQKAPTYQEAIKSPILIPEEYLRSYIASRQFEQGVVVRKDFFDSKEEGLTDMLPPETGLMLNAFRTGKIAGKEIAKISLGDEIKDVQSFEQTNTFHGSVVIVEDQAKKERYICRAFVTDSKDGVEKLLPVNANAPGKDELAGYKCTTEKKAQETISPLTTVEKKEAQKALTSSERLYKAFVLDKIVKEVKKIPVGSTKKK